MGLLVRLVAALFEDGDMSQITTRGGEWTQRVWLYASFTEGLGETTPYPLDATFGGM